jgi:hypothetical protein
MQVVHASGVLPVNGGSENKKRYEHENNEADPGLLGCNHQKPLFASRTQFASTQQGEEQPQEIPNSLDL